MLLRPASTRWFEVVCPRSESVRTAAALAETGAVEVEILTPPTGDFPVPRLAEALAEYRALHTRYARYWARGTLRRRALPEAPIAVVRHALAGIAAWRVEADPAIDALQACEEESLRLTWLARIVEHIADSDLDFAAAGRAGPLLGTFCAVFPRDAALDLPAPVLARTVPWEDERCGMFLGPRDALDRVKHLVQSLKGRIVERPDWLQGDAATCASLLRGRRERLAVRRVHLYAELDTLFDHHDLGHLLGEVEGLAWFAEHVGSLPAAGDHLVWLTGWTDDLDGQRLDAALERANCRALLRLTPPPPGTRPPLVLTNPPWLRPFEPLARAFGTPGADEADPTPVLAVAVPLLFGYMFGDLGQGAVVALAGVWLLRRGWGSGRLLVLAGLSAMAFGLVFGSVFAREDLLPALWVHPLEEPLPVLVVPLVFAVLLLSLGQLLAGLGALWRGELRRWLAMDLGFLFLYLGLAGMALDRRLVWVALLGAAWYAAGAFLVHRALLGGLAALAHLIELGMQLLVNTLSFARVGAFALAHAALSAAIVTMAEGAPWWAWLAILVLGNALIVILEGLVVSIQTTRLMLFEFFNRFLRGAGRVFRPLPPPPTVRGAAV